MKPNSILNTVGLLITAVVFSVIGAGDVHAQDNTSASGTSAPQSTASKVLKQPCAGPSGILCPGGMKCIDDPSDKCDPTKDGINCVGICVAGAPASKVKQPCAGPSGITCPGGMTCIDDPSDKCDPTKDGVNCVGMCVAR